VRKRPGGVIAMVSLLRQTITSATLLRLGADLACLFVVVILAVRLHGHHTPSLEALAVPALAFAVLIVCLNGWVGLYRRDRKLPFVAHVGWIFFALLLSVPAAYLLALLLPNGEIFQEILGSVLVMAFGGLVIVRHAVVGPLVTTLLPHRVLVLGTGAEARVVEASLNDADTPGLQVVGFYALEKVQETVVSPNRVLAKVGPNERIVTLEVHEVSDADPLGNEPLFDRTYRRWVAGSKVAGAQTPWPGLKISRSSPVERSTMKRPARLPEKIR